LDSPFPTQLADDPIPAGDGTAMRHGELMGNTNMAPKSGYRFSDKAMFKQRDQLAVTLQDRSNRNFA
jgi:hypothetical protein